MKVNAKYVECTLNTFKLVYLQSVNVCICSVEFREIFLKICNFI